MTFEDSLSIYAAKWGDVIPARIFWSIYFVVFIGIIGFLLGYVCTLSLFILSFLFRSDRIRIFAENFQCYSIRLLMRLQPWFQCETNLPGISEIYQKIGSRRVIFAANHRSNLDTFILISYIPGLRGMAKSSLFYNIFFAPIMWIIGFIPVEKGNLRSFLEGLALVRKKILDRNRSLLIFPETTRCQKGAVGVGKFSAAIFQLAVDSQAVIVPIALQNTDQLYGRGDLLLNPFQKTKVTMLEPIFPNQLPTTGQDQAEHLKDLVWNRISRELA